MLNEDNERSRNLYLVINRRVLARNYSQKQELMFHDEKNETKWKGNQERILLYLKYKYFSLI